MKILIVGASGGIGLALVKGCLNDYPEADIFATYHRHSVDFTHPKLQWIKLDVTDEKHIEQLSKRVSSLDILINAVGFLHSGDQKPEKSLTDFNKDFFEKNISLNTLPSILLAKYFENALRAPAKNTFYIVLSARIGSIKDNKLGGWLSYRMSKAALNMAIKTVSIEWQRKLPRCCVLLFHPGTTDTELSKPFQTNLPKGQLHSPGLVSERLLALIKNSDPSDTGKFISFDGTEIEW